jgi:hypothetical protein
MHHIQNVVYLVDGFAAPAGWPVGLQRSCPASIPAFRYGRAARPPAREALRLAKARSSSAAECLQAQDKPRHVDRFRFRPGIGRGRRGHHKSARRRDDQAAAADHYA